VEIRRIYSNRMEKALMMCEKVPISTSDTQFVKVSQISPECIVLEQRIRTHFTERIAQTHNVLWLKKSYVRVVKIEKVVRMMLTRKKESEDINLQVILDGATITEDSFDIYGNVIIIITLENDPIYHHCHLQIKRKTWLTSWEPVLQKLLFPQRMRSKKALLESPRKTHHMSRPESPLKVSSFKNDSIENLQIRPRSKSIESLKPIKERQVKKQRRKSAHPSIVKDNPLILEPILLPRFDHFHTNLDNVSPRKDDVNSIFEAAVEIPNKGVDIIDVYNLLQNLYKEILLMKKDVRQLKVDLAILKEAQK